MKEGKRKQHDLGESAEQEKMRKHCLLVCSFVELEIRIADSSGTTNETCL